MLSNKPYLIRAFFQWIVDSACTPILVLDANNPRCKIPQEFVEGGEIVFNISPTAIRDLKMTNDFIEFKASFSGVVHLVYAPVKAVLSIYAEENGEGVFFDMEEDEDAEEEIMQVKGIEGSVAESLDLDVAQKSPNKKAKPILKLVE